jgi:glycosyltransferase-like protein
VSSIGIFTYSTKPRGSVVHAAALAEALTRMGEDVTLYALGKGGASFYRPLRCRSVVVPAGDAPADVEALIRQRVDELATGCRASAARHDVLHAEDCLAANAILALRPPAAVAVRTVHHVERFESPFLADCQRRSVLEVDAVFSVSRATQREVEREYGRSSARVHNGVDVARFAGPPPRGREWLRQRFGVSPEHTIVLSVGGVEPRKNTRTALAAAARVFAARRDASWIIAGGETIWDHSAYAEAFAGDVDGLAPDVARRVVRAGPLSEDDLTALYRLADVLLCPSKLEGFGLCVLEAAAAGAAVIVPGGEPFTEFLDDASAAFVDAASTDSVAVALALLVDDPGHRARVAASARARAARLTWDRSAEDHRRLYAELRHA